MATQWGRVRQSYMAGASYEELAKKYGVKVKTIQNRASKEGWVQEKGKIAEEVGEKIHARVVRARVKQLEKLMDANEQLMDGLLKVTEMIQAHPEVNLFDVNKSLKNAESIAKAIQTAVQTQRDLFKLPTLDQEQRRKEFNAKKVADQQKRKIDRERLKMDQQKWEAEKTEKAKVATTAEGTVWQVEAPDGMVLDG